MDSNLSKLHLEIIDKKNEIENTKLIISSIKMDLNSTRNKNRLSKIKSQKFHMERRLRGLVIEKEKLEKQYALMSKTERKEVFE